MSPDIPRYARGGTVLAGMIAAIVLIAMTTYRLERAGAYYDELHQAPGAFAYIGRPTTLFSFVPIGGVPLLNMPYTGAVKTAIYGLYLRASDRSFSIFSWRLLGILFSAAGLIAFALLAAGRIPVAAAAVFFALVLSDTNLLLQTRHDWGPAALAFLLRMILIGVAVRHLTGSRSRWTPFLLGIIVGFAIFEKLSSAILMGPLAIILLADPASRSVRAVLRAATGVFVGALPVILVNLHSLVTTSTLLALSSLDMTPRRSLFSYAANYLALGNGGIERRMIFDVAAYRLTDVLEAAAILGLLLVVGGMVWKHGRASATSFVAGVMVMCYLAIGAALPLLPHGTGEHHWIIGTPFQYLAIALAAVELWRPSVRSRGMRALLVASVALLLLARVPAVGSAYSAIRDDKYTLAWHPSLNTAAEFIARQPESAIVMTANWGIGAQVFCFANGRENFLFEMYAAYFRPDGEEALQKVLEPAERQIVIAAALRPATTREFGQENTLLQIRDAIFRDLAEEPEWEAIPVDPSVRGLRAVEIRMFQRKKR